MILSAYFASDFKVKLQQKKLSKTQLFVAMECYIICD